MSHAFIPEEIDQRRRTVAHALDAPGLDGLLCFRPESVAWLGGASEADGLPTCVLLDADGALGVGSRPAGAHAEPTPAIAALVAERGLSRGRLGVEYAGLDGASALGLGAALGDACRLDDASQLLERQRAFKSPLELAYLRRAAGLADDAFDSARMLVGPGAWDGDILAALQEAVLRGGGGPPAQAPALTAGAGANPGDARDRLPASGAVRLEWAGSYRRYHAPMAQTWFLGEADARRHSLYAAAAEALDACVEAARPGATAGAVFDAQARALASAAPGAEQAPSCGASAGLAFAPARAQAPVLRSGSDDQIGVGMALVLRVDVTDPASGERVVLARTVEISEAGAVLLHRHGTDVAPP